MHQNCQNHLLFSNLFNYKQVSQAFQTFSLISIITYFMEIPYCVLKNSILLEHAWVNSPEISHSLFEASTGSLQQLSTGSQQAI